MARKKRKKMGRPPLPKGTARNTSVTIRLSEQERKIFESEAKRQALSLSELIMLPWREDKQ